MSLPHAVLGFLRAGPMTGYDLKKRFDATVRHFWPADRAQIYRSLARLAEQGWADVERRPQRGRPDQRLHRITRAGREELERWLTTPQPAPEVREASLIQVFFADAVPDARARAILREQRAALEAQMAGLEGLGVTPDPQRDPKRRHARERFYRGLTLDHGITMLRAEIAWLETAIERLDAAAQAGWKR